MYVSNLTSSLALSPILVGTGSISTSVQSTFFVESPIITTPLAASPNISTGSTRNSTFGASNIGTGSILSQSFTSNPSSSDSNQAADICNSASQSFSSLYVSSELVPTLSFYTFEKLTFLPPANATPYTTLCDGAPRAHGSYIWKDITVTSTFSDNATTYLTISGQSAPTCTVNPAQCSYLWNSYSSALSSIGATHSGDTPFTVVIPVACGNPATTLTGNPLTTYSVCPPTKMVDDAKHTCYLKGGK